MIALAFIGTQELLLILLIVLLLFGASKLPKLASSVGVSIKNLKKGMNDAEEEGSEQTAERRALEPEKEGNDDTTDSSDRNARK